MCIKYYCNTIISVIGLKDYASTMCRILWLRTQGCLMGASWYTTIIAAVNALETTTDCFLRMFLSFNVILKLVSSQHSELKVLEVIYEVSWHYYHLVLLKNYMYVSRIILFKISSMPESILFFSIWLELIVCLFCITPLIIIS